MRFGNRSSRHPTLSGEPVRTYWWNESTNFGDLLGPLLLQHFGVPVRFAPVSEASVVGPGSILGKLPASYRGFVWGSGLIDADLGHPSQVESFRDASILAVRGHLTSDVLGLDSGVALGDPGLLASRVLNKASPRWELGIVPHYAHLGDPFLARLRRTFPNARVIDVRRPPIQVIRDISSCGSVISSSLHGLIVADSFGLPASWFASDTVLPGGDFKFRDYESVFPERRNRKLMHGVGDLRGAVSSALGSVDLNVVERASVGLLRGIARIRNEFVNPE